MGEQQRASPVSNVLGSIFKQGRSRKKASFQGLSSLRPFQGKTAMSRPVEELEEGSRTGERPTSKGRDDR